ncbi:hypothetical protein OBK24_07305 [Empedobacter falsenii]
MKEEDILIEIKRIATLLQENKQFMTRKELAKSLHSFGIEKDSIDLNNLIIKANEYYKTNNNIFKVFYNNEFSRSLLDEVKLPVILNDESNVAAVKFFLKNNENITKNILPLLNNIDLPEDFKNKAGGLISKLTGTSGIKKKNEEAEILMKNYNSLVDKYEFGADEIKNSFKDFVLLREKIESIYNENIILLRDIFGDRIKSVDSELFDFDSVEFLNTREMYDKVNLQFEDFQKKGSLLLNEISSNFKVTTQETINEVSKFKTNAKKEAVINAAINVSTNLISHYTDVKQKKIILEKELNNLKDIVYEDVSTIKGDLARLTLVFKKMNEYHIPKAEAFYSFCDSIFMKEFKSLQDLIYGGSELKILKNRRDEILKECSTIRLKIFDLESNITIDESNIESYKNSIQILEPNFKNSISLKPIKPNFIFNLITFGVLNKKYSKKLYYWDQEYGFSVNRFEGLIKKLNLTEIDVDNYKIDLIEIKKYNIKLQEELREINSAIFSSINVNIDVRKKVAENLKSIIQLLRLAKEILESKIDEKYLKVFKINKLSDVQIPANVNDNLLLFTQEFISKVNLDVDFTSSIINPKLKTHEDEYEHNLFLQTINQKHNLILKQTLNLYNEWNSLDDSNKNSEFLRKEYDKQLEALKNKMKKDIEELDHSSEELRTAITKLNLSNNENETKENLINLLNKSGIDFSDADFSDFLVGKKDIVL